MFGSSRPVISCGDVDGDGTADFAHRQSTSTWRVRSGADGTALTTLGSSVISSWNETTACGLSDVNGDGAADLVIADTVQLSLYSGADNQLLWSLPLATGGVGQIISSAVTLESLADVNGDGIRDFLVGPPSVGAFGFILPGFPGGMFGNPQGTSSALIEVRSGADGSVLSTITPPTNATVPNVSRGGDLDGDGDEDIVVLGIDLQNSVLTVYGHDAASGAQITSFPALPQSTFLYSAQCAGGDDFDGDGIDDVVVTIPQSQAGGPNSGEILVQSGADGSLIRSVTGTPCAGIGVLPVVGDFNGDDRGDFASTQFDDTGAPNIGRIFSGVSGDELENSIGDLTNCDGVLLTDLDGDGFDEFIAVGTAADALSGTHTFSFVVYAGGPLLGDAAENNDGMGDDLLRVNGSAGDARRCVEVARGAPINFTMLQPAMNPQPADYAIFGCFGVPRENETFDGGPGVGDFAMIPAPALPWAVPTLFTLATSVNGVAGTIFQTGPAPWTLDLPQGIDAEITFTLQAVVKESPTELRKTNGLIVRIK